MTIVPSPAAPTHDIGGARFTSLATPSLGSTDTSVWIVEIDPGAPATPHELTREEVFVVLSGRAAVQLGGTVSVAGPGDAVVVPKDTAFAISADGAEALRMVCCFPVGGQARLEDGATFTPPWAL